MLLSYLAAPTDAGSYNLLTKLLEKLEQCPVKYDRAFRGCGPPKCHHGNSM